MMSRLIMAAMVVQGSRRVRITQDDIEPSIDRCQHEARRNEAAQAKHCEHERYSPMAGAVVLRLFTASLHGPGTMPEALQWIKSGFSVRTAIAICQSLTE